METPTAQPRSKGALRRLVIALGTLLVLVLAAVTVLLALVQSDQVISRVKDSALPKISASLGREITIDAVKVRVFPRPRVTLEHLAVHGLAGEPAILETDAAEVDLKPWPFFRSLGKDVEFEAISLVRPQVNLVRDRAGKWNFEGPAGGGTSGPSDREVGIARVDVVDGVVHVIDRSGGAGATSLLLHQLDLRLENLGVGRSLSVKGDAAFASGSQNLHLELTTSPLQPGVLPELNGKLALQGAELPRLRALLPPKVFAIASGGRVDVDLNVASAAGTYTLQGDARVDALQLRGGPARGSFRFKTLLDPNDLDATEVNVSQLRVEGPGLDLSGRVQLSWSPRSVRFALSSSLLNLDPLLAALSEPNAPNETATKRPLQLSRTVREQLESFDLRGSLEIDRLVKGKLEIEKLDAQAVLHKGVLTLEQARAKAFDGEVDASGTTARLTTPVPRWKLRAHLQNVDLGSVMTSASFSGPVVGRITASLTVNGEGLDWGKLRQTMTADGAVALHNGALVMPVLGTLLGGKADKVLKVISRKTSTGGVEAVSGRTAGSDLTTSFRVADGDLVLPEPMPFSTPIAVGTLAGRIKLDGSIEMGLDLVVSKDFVAKFVGPVAKLGDAISLPLEMGGTVKNPEITGIDKRELAAQRVQGSKQNEAVRQMRDELKRQGRTPPTRRP